VLAVLTIFSSSGLISGLIGCAQPTPARPAPAGDRPALVPAPSPPGALYSLLHRSLKVPEGLVEVLRLHGQGTQIFRCEPRGADLHWAYRLPQADLSDAQGRVLVHHGANLSFEHVDGSRIVADVVDHIPSPEDRALPWLLMATRDFGTGALSGVRYVERVDTAGGMPPETCDASQRNQVLRVPFAADFVFLR
jgi:hypothetical protein